jgi:CO/xanthine dehydrogenase Mo-binding subunit
MQIHAAMLALRTGKPVKMVYNREESFFGHVHRHPAVMRYEHGASADGKLVFRQGGDRPRRRRIRLDHTCRRRQRGLARRWTV